MGNRYRLWNNSPDPEAIKRQSRISRSGHYWGSHEAARFLRDCKDIGEAAAKAFIAASMEGREPLLHSMGVIGDDLREWRWSCVKAFAAKIEAFRVRHARRAKQNGHSRHA